MAAAPTSTVERALTSGRELRERTRPQRSGERAGRPPRVGGRLATTEQRAIRAAAKGARGRTIPAHEAAFMHIAGGRPPVVDTGGSLPVNEQADIVRGSVPQAIKERMRQGELVGGRPMRGDVARGINSADLDRALQDGVLSELISAASDTGTSAEARGSNIRAIAAFAVEAGISQEEIAANLQQAGINPETIFGARVDAGVARPSGGQQASPDAQAADSRNDTDTTPVSESQKQRYEAARSKIGSLQKRLERLRELKGSSNPEDLNAAAAIERQEGNSEADLERQLAEENLKLRTDDEVVGQANSRLANAIKQLGKRGDRREIESMQHYIESHPHDYILNSQVADHPISDENVSREMNGVLRNIRKFGQPNWMQSFLHRNDAAYFEGLEKKIVAEQILALTTGDKPTLDFLKDKYSNKHAIRNFILILLITLGVDFFKKVLPPSMESSYR